MTVQLVYIKRRSTMTRDMIVGSFRLRELLDDCLCNYTRAGQCLEE